MTPSYTPDDLENAYLDVTDNHLSLKRAASKHEVPRVSLWNRLHGINPRGDRLQDQRLSPAEEQKLVQ